LVLDPLKNLRRRKKVRGHRVYARESRLGE